MCNAYVRFWNSSANIILRLSFDAADTLDSSFVKKYSPLTRIGWFILPPTTLDRRFLHDGRDHQRMVGDPHYLFFVLVSSAYLIVVKHDLARDKNNRYSCEKENTGDEGNFVHDFLMPFECSDFSSFPRMIY